MLFFLIIVFKIVCCKLWCLTLKDCPLPIQEHNVVSRLLEQLSCYLPLLKVCLIYDDNGQQQLIDQNYSLEKNAEFSSLVLDQWWQNNIRCEQVNHITSNQNFSIYVYPFNIDYEPDFFKTTDQPEYLLTLPYIKTVENGSISESQNLFYMFLFCF